MIGSEGVKVKADLDDFFIYNYWFYLKHGYLDGNHKKKKNKKLTLRYVKEKQTNKLKTTAESPTMVYPKLNVIFTY
jgi:hypothetical protein